MKNLLLIIFIAITWQSQSQRNQFPMMLNGEEKAYMYHIVMKSKILRTHLAPYFHYTGEMIYLQDNSINYDSLEIMITQKPSLLVVETQELARQSKGLLSELTTKMALWKLNKALKFGTLKNDEYQHLSEIYNDYMDLVLKYLPAKAVKTKKDESYIPKKLTQLATPTFSLNDKLAVIGGNSKYTPEDQKGIIDAFHRATNEWVEKESEKIFHQTGGKADTYINKLQAAGDGSITSGLLDENEKDENGKFNKGLPKAVGLFTYQLELRENERGKKEVKPTFTPENRFKTVVKPERTNVHFSVWGFNADKQTTICIQKGGNTYLLYGSEKSRMLSPDSTFGEGLTYHRHIDKVENEFIAELKENIYGKKGFEYWINHNKDLLDDVMMGIKKTEVSLSNYRQHGASPGKRIKKKKKKAQSNLIVLYEKKESLETEIRELEQAWEEAMEKLNELETKLDKMKKNIGYTWLEYQVKDSMYTFTDGATFNMKTQDFRFPITEYQEEFTVRTIAIGNVPFTKFVDEVNVHINITNVEYREELLLDLALEDVFDSDQFLLDQNLFSEEDSTKMYELTNLIQKKDFKYKIEGQGIGKIEHNIIEKDPSPVELNSYEGDKDQPQYKELRRNLLWVDDNEENPFILIRSYCDPVRSNLNIEHKSISKLMSKYPQTTKNEILTGLRALTVYHKFIDEMIQFSSKNLDRDEANKVIDLLESSKKKAEVKINKGTIRYKDVVDLIVR